MIKGSSRQVHHVDQVGQVAECSSSKPPLPPAAAQTAAAGGDGGGSPPQGGRGPQLR